MTSEIAFVIGDTKVYFTQLILKSIIYKIRRKLQWILMKTLS